jgi:hypothetical protein
MTIETTVDHVTTIRAMLDAIPERACNGCEICRRRAALTESLRLLESADDRTDFYNRLNKLASDLDVRPGTDMIDGIRKKLVEKRVLVCKHEKTMTHEKINCGLTMLRCTYCGVIVPESAWR